MRSEKMRTVFDRKKKTIIRENSLSFHCAKGNSEISSLNEAVGLIQPPVGPLLARGPGLQSLKPLH